MCAAPVETYQDSVTDKLQELEQVVNSITGATRVLQVLCTVIEDKQVITDRKEVPTSPHSVATVMGKIDLELRRLMSARDDFHDLNYAIGKALIGEVKYNELCKVLSESKDNGK